MSVSVRYNVSSSTQGLTVTSVLSAPSYSHVVSNLFLKPAKAREFSRQLTQVNALTVLMAVLSLSSVVAGIYAAGYGLYALEISNQIDEFSDLYPGVHVKVVDAGKYGTHYTVDGWNDITTAVVYLTKTDIANESITGVYLC